MSEKWLLIFAMDNLDIHTQKEIYDQFYYLVYDMVLYTLQDPASVEDVIQESFIKAMYSPPEQVDPTRLKAWLKTVTRNKCLDYLRKYKKIRNEHNIENVNINNITKMFDNVSSIEKHVLNKMSVEEIMEEVDNLKPDYKRIFILKFIHDLSTQQIASIMDIPQPKVRQWVFRSKEAIIKVFKKRWGEPNEPR